MKLFLLLLLLSFSWVGRAQTEAKAPSNWLIGLETGLHLPHAGRCSPCFTNDNHYSLHSHGLLMEHRIFRWLSVRARFGYRHLRANDLSTDFFRQLSPMGGDLVLNDRLNELGSTMGPRLQYRVGQGDLGIEYRDGLAWRWLDKTITTSERAYHINYQTNITRLSAIRLSYTYWPKPNWAIELAYESLQTRNPPPFEPEVPFEQIFEGVSHSVVSELQNDHGSHIRASFVYISFLARL